MMLNRLWQTSTNRDTSGEGGRPFRVSRRTTRWSGRSLSAVSCTIWLCCAAELEAVRCYGEGIEATGRC